MTDRKKVIKGLECCREMNGHACRKCPYISDCNNMSVAGISHLASDALTLLKEQKHGHWKYGMICSVCNEPMRINLDGRRPEFAGIFYCPHCGAKMDDEVMK